MLSSPSLFIESVAVLRQLRCLTGPRQQPRRCNRKLTWKTVAVAVTLAATIGDWNVALVACTLRHLNCTEHTSKTGKIGVCGKAGRCWWRAWARANDHLEWASTAERFKLLPQRSKHMHGTYSAVNTSSACMA